MPIDLPPRRLRLLAVAALLALPRPRPAAAQVLPLPTPTLEYSSTEVTARVFRTGALVADDRRDIGPTETGLANALYTAPDLSRFPTSRSAQPEGFASALMAGTGFGGVGISYFIPGKSPIGAFATWRQSVTNTGPIDAPVVVDYTIPEIETSILAGADFGPFNGGEEPAVRVVARLAAERILPGGGLGGQVPIFDYGLELFRVIRGSEISSYFVERSDDLVADAGNGRVLRAGDVTGIRYDAFSGTRTIGTLNPGERFDLTYILSAEGPAQRPGAFELGYQGLVGDPFAVGGGAGLLVRVGSAVVTPEPSAAALLAGGLALLAFGARRAARRG